MFTIFFLCLKSSELDASNSAPESGVTANFIERIDLRVPMEMLGVSLFVNLKVLIISPHNLGEDLVECLGNFLFPYLPNTS